MFAGDEYSTSAEAPEFEITIECGIGALRPFWEQQQQQVSKCLADTSASVWWCRNVLGPKCPRSEVSWHRCGRWWHFSMTVQLSCSYVLP